MAEPTWPDPSSTSLLGKRVSRVDGPMKTKGAAPYPSDVARPGMLHARAVRCPHAHARVTSIDLSAAETMPGVAAIDVVKKAGDEIQWALDEIAWVAAATEGAAEDAARAVRVTYEVLPHQVRDDDPSVTGAKESSEEKTGDPDAAMKTAAVRVRGSYGLPSVAHLCLEAHGQVAEWQPDGSLRVWISTQNVSGMPGQFAEALDIPASRVRATCEVMGGGFGSKFAPDPWGIAGARLAKKTGKPVRLVLDREAEVAVAGDRPSAFAEVEVGVSKEGKVVAWSSRSWGSGGVGGTGSPPVPYVFEFPDRRHRHTSIPTNTAPSRAWRAPGHPQGCLITMAALEDAAAALGMDPLEFFLANLDVTGPRKDVYRDEFRIAADLMGWQKKWHPRGQAGSGPVKRGLGLSLHTWGGRGHRSACDVTIQPDGAVEVRIGSQDLGTGTRTVIGIVVAETFGLPLDAVSVRIGDSSYPPSGASGGSTTVGGVSASSRRAALKALEGLFEKVAPSLQVKPDDLEAAGGKVRVRSDPERALTWEQAARRLGGSPLTARGDNPGPGRLTDSGVGGVQMAEVAVDVDTGIVRVETMVAVQDCGLVVDRKTAESQVHGGLIMGISYALTEEKVLDSATGRLLNPDMEFYKIPGIADVGELIVHMVTGEGHDERGVIGLGEPPVISPGAAISNAVANAIGVRVPRLPLTPDRVLAAIGSSAKEVRG